MTDISENKSLLNKTPDSVSPLSKLAKFLDFVWPVTRSELPKFLFITLLMFCILGIQNLIRAMKDSHGDYFLFEVLGSVTSCVHDNNYLC